jgi:hypothetical protein
MVPSLGNGMVPFFVRFGKIRGTERMPPPGLLAPLPGHAATPALPRGHATNGIGGSPLLNLD